MTNFRELLKCVKAYYAENLSQGHELRMIIDMFKDGLISSELLQSCKGWDEPSIRRAGQQVGTSYIIQLQGEAELPETDLVYTPL